MKLARKLPTTTSNPTFNPSALKAIIFDMDDTLYPEQAFVFSGFRAVAAWAETQWQIPANEGYARLLELFHAGARGDTFNRWLDGYGFPEVAQAVPQLVAVYREHEPEIELFPEVPAILARLKHRFRLGLISDGYLAVQQRKLAALQIAGIFESVIFSDQWGREAWKPAARPYEAALAQLCVSPEEAVYIADNPKKDFLGARQVGMWSIWLRQPEGEYSHLQPASIAHEPHITVQSWPELSEFFESAVGG
jgi:putative hydrolase of the HAD superfamily